MIVSMDNFDDYSFTELINETKEYYPELLEDPWHQGNVW